MTDQLKRAISAAKTAQSNSEQADSIGAASSSAGDQNFDMSESSYKTSHTAIRKARRFAMQGLYEWLITDHRFDLNGKLGWKANAPHDIAARTRATNAMHTVHIGYYHEMMHDIPEQIESLNALIIQHLDREIDKLDTVEHAILLIGAYELQNRLEIPYKVVLDEAMKLNNHFGATDAHKLINAVLDRMAVELRDVEVQADIKANLRTSQKSATKKTAEAQIATTDNTADTDGDSKSKPTASTKPRISANNATVKRNRPNKANTGSSNVKEALAKNSVEKEISAESVATVSADAVEISDIKVNSSIADDVAINNETVVNEGTDNTVSTVITDDAKALPEAESSVVESEAVLEGDVLEESIVENEGSDVSATDSIGTSDSDSISVEADNIASNSAELESTVVNDTEVDSIVSDGTELNDIDTDNSDAKSND
ncbi:transcription antitermination factor NusB [Psychrobacter sp. CAL346-MNA-CIBAN-0220]|uniref:transcription antitermination factor NusB n=2 Tax=Gammaproteobacteria TaxID=1236 RepID=UPI00332F1774